jgi:hypothetical protein
VWVGHSCPTPLTLILVLLLPLLKPQEQIQELRKSKASDKSVRPTRALPFPKLSSHFLHF